MTRIQNYINHIGLVIDASTSMRSYVKDVVKVCDATVKHLAQRSKELDQETRISIYMFGDTTECLVFDMDVMRFNTIESYYAATGRSTALIDGTLKCIEDMRKIPELYGDSATLIYVITDGGENSSQAKPAALQATLNSLPENWTMAALVPTASSVHEAKKFGFPSGNVEMWNVSAQGVQEVGRRAQQTADAWMTNRAKGVRSTSTLFQTDLTGVNLTTVRKAGNKLTNYTLYPVKNNGSEIRTFVEFASKKPYKLGSAFYELTKPEKIQSGKEVLVQHIDNGEVYDSGRSVLGLPDVEIKVKPADHGKFKIFVQSASVNRKLVKGTAVIVKN